MSRRQPRGELLDTGDAFFAIDEQTVVTPAAYAAALKAEQAAKAELTQAQEVVAEGWEVARILLYRPPADDLEVECWLTLYPNLRLPPEEATKLRQREVTDG